jgi:hypothetical protein
MNKSMLFRMLCLAAILGGLGAAEHPRLFFTAADIPALRQKITQEPWKSMYQRLVADAEVVTATVIPEADALDGPTAYKSFSAFRASKCGFLYVLTGDDAWAAKALTYTKNIFNGAWNQTSAKGLGLYMHNKHVAQTYDFCYNAPSWAADRAAISAQLKLNTQCIYTNGGAQQNTDMVSNWMALRYSSAGLGYLAMDETFTAGNLSTCYAKLKTYCDSNMGTAASPGWNFEGLGYTYYPWGMGAGAFGIAYQRQFPTSDIRTANPNVPTTFWTTVAANALFTSLPNAVPAVSLIGSHPEFADEQNHTMGEGTYGLAFHYLPAELKPGYLWMYNRMRGAQGDNSWDNERAGGIYSILWHPGTTITEQNPMDIPAWRNLFKDLTGNGHNIFRNRYQDENDIVAALNLRLRLGGGNGHWGADTQVFRISGMGLPFAVGGGGGGGANNDRNQNTLYPVDPATGTLTTVSAAHSAPVTTAHTPLFNSDGSGALVAKSTTSALSVTNHTRRWLADFSAASGAAGVFVCADTSDNGTWWQYSTVDTVCSISTSGNSFTVSGPTGSLKATIVHPASATFAQGTLTRTNKYFYHGSQLTANRYINVRSADGDFLVVMTIQPTGAAHPTVTSLAGSAVTDRTLAIGGLQVAIAGDDIRTLGTVANNPPTISAAANAAPSPLVLP